MIKRRTALKRLGQLAGLGALAGLYTWKIEPFWLEFVHRSLPVKNLPSHLVGNTLMQISDLHVGEDFNHQFIINSFQEATKLEPDYVVYTGDFVSYQHARQLDQLREVLGHAVLGRKATFAILGNHDYGKNWEERAVAGNIVSLLAEAGITTLRNESEEADGLTIIGLDDLWGTNFRPEKALQNFSAEQANILLCHNPDVCDLDVWNGYQGWILAGHTHGGQCKPPFLPPPILPVENKAYTSGEFDLGDGRMLYINRALGHAMQVRFNVRPEITVFTLT